MGQERDHIILERIARGDRAAFDELYSLYGRQLYVFIFRYMTSSQEAEEVLQETFLKVLQNRGGISHHGSLRAWLYTVARNTSLNRIRSHNCVRANEKELVIHAEKQIFDPLEETKLDHQWVTNEVTTLSPIFRDIFELRTSGQSYEEMSIHLGIPVGTVKSRMHEGSVVSFENCHCLLLGRVGKTSRPGFQRTRTKRLYRIRIGPAIQPCVTGNRGEIIQDRRWFKSKMPPNF